jgi:hypothetical protein
MEELIMAIRKIFCFMCFNIQMGFKLCRFYYSIDSIVKTKYILIWSNGVLYFLIEIYLFVSLLWQWMLLSMSFLFHLISTVKGSLLWKNGFLLDIFQNWQRLDKIQTFVFWLAPLYHAKFIYPPLTSICRLS